MARNFSFVLSTIFASCVGSVNCRGTLSASAGWILRSGYVDAVAAHRARGPFIVVLLLWRMAARSVPLMKAWFAIVGVGVKAHRWQILPMCRVPTRDMVVCPRDNGQFWFLGAPAVSLSPIAHVLLK